MKDELRIHGGDDPPAADLLRTDIKGARAAKRSSERSGFGLGRWFGVEVRADASLLIIFALLLLDLGYGQFPRWHPDWSAGLCWGVAFASALLFFFSVLLHELSHALVARTQGVTVSRITLFVFGGLAHLDREPPSAKAELLMTIVGPLTSLAIGVGAILLGFQLVYDTPPRSADAVLRALRGAGPLGTLLVWLGPINVMLAVFNLLPGFPLDGGRVLRSLLWWGTGDLQKATRWATFAGQVLAWGLMALGVVDMLGGALLQGLWLLLIGWLLNAAAVNSYQRMVVARALRDVSVERVMRTQFERLPPDMTVEALVRDHLIASDQHGFPVEAEGVLAGIVTREDVRKLPHEAWPATRIASIMTPSERLTTLPPEAGAERALDALAQRDVDQIPIVDHGRLLGMVLRGDLLKWVALRASA